MRKILINIGKRSKQAFAQPVNTYKKNKVLSDYLKMIRKNKHLILKENKNWSSTVGREVDDVWNEDRTTND